MKKNLSIFEVEETMNRDRTKTYWKVKTNQGIYSVWEEDVAGDLRDSLGRVCEVEVEIKGIYKNITAFYGANGPAEVQAKPEIKPASKIASPAASQSIPQAKSSYEEFEEKKQKNIAKASAIKLKSISVAYAVQKYNAEIPALIAKTRDMGEALIVIQKREQEIAEKANGFYQLIKNLELVKSPILEGQPKKEVSSEEEIDDEDLEYDDMEVEKI